MWLSGFIDLCKDRPWLFHFILFYFTWLNALSALMGGLYLTCPCSCGLVVPFMLLAPSKPKCLPSVSLSTVHTLLWSRPPSGTHFSLQAASRPAESTVSASPRPCLFFPEATISAGMDFTLWVPNHQRKACHHLLQSRKDSLQVE